MHNYNMYKSYFQQKSDGSKDGRMFYVARNKWLKEDEDVTRTYNAYDQETSLPQVKDQLMH